MKQIVTHVLARMIRPDRPSAIKPTHLLERRRSMRAGAHNGPAFRSWSLFSHPKRQATRLTS